MDIREILEYLPHRYPMLLLDRVLECEPGKRLLALKNISMNEPFFAGHFPHYPVMPGVMIIEALAQAAAVLSFRTMNTRPDDKSVYYFAGIDEARFKRPVVPGTNCCSRSRWNAAPGDSGNSLPRRASA